MDEQILEELSESLFNDQLILFVGAGVSMSLGLPSYPALIRELGELLDYDGDIFHGFGDYLTLAEYYHLQRPGFQELQRHLRTQWSRSDAQIKNSAVHKGIVDLNASIIYTTNFDGFIEKAHRLHNKPYKKIRSVKDLVNQKPDTTQIIKLHGDIDSPSTLVFTESSYFERLSFESPLDIKLRADALGKSILFLGYSLSDINIRYLIYRLQKQWDLETDKTIRPKSYIFIGRPNPVLEAVLKSRGIIPIIANDDDVGKSLVNFLTQIKSKEFL